HLAPEETTVDDAIESLRQLGDIAAWYFFKYLGQVPLEALQEEKPPPPSPTTQSVLRVAILYKRKTSEEDLIGSQDEQVLHWLETQFRAAGHSVFIDRHLAIGEQWAKEIARQIKESDAVVPLLSEKSIESDMLSYEVKLAHEAQQLQHGKPRLLPVRVKFTGRLPGEMSAIMDSLQYFLWEGPQDNQRLIDSFSRAFLNPSSLLASPRLKLEQEGGAVPLDSQFYVVRPVDNEFYQAIGRRDSILLLKGARQMGKTSLLSRALEQARGSGFRVAITDFQKLDAAQLESIESFFQALGAMIAIQLDLEAFPQDVWKRQLGAKENFERYLRREVLAKAESPLVWAMDEVDRLFACPFGSDVCGLFRSWWNARAYEPAGSVVQAYLGDRLRDRGAFIHYRHEPVSLQCRHAI
ncbi:MAG TPA: AAA-like domain-containing protein, partial [Terrimicrobiaceae bacterium]